MCIFLAATCSYVRPLARTSGTTPLYALRTSLLIQNSPCNVHVHFFFTLLLKKKNEHTQTEKKNSKVNVWSILSREWIRKRVSEEDERNFLSGQKQRAASDPHILLSFQNHFVSLSLFKSQKKIKRIFFQICCSKCTKKHSEVHVHASLFLAQCFLAKIWRNGNECPPSIGCGVRSWRLRETESAHVTFSVPILMSK